MADRPSVQGAGPLMSQLPRIEYLPDGRTRIYHRLATDKCPLCGGSGKTHSSYSVGPNYTEYGPLMTCRACYGTGKTK
jgi:hypothetical protein